MHGLNISNDGKRAYLAARRAANPQRAVRLAAEQRLAIFDVSQVQARVPNPQITASSARRCSRTARRAAHDPRQDRRQAVRDHGRRGRLRAGNNVGRLERRLHAGLPPFPMARIYDISDETKPKVVSKLMLETHDPKNCAQVLPDIAGLAIFTYGSHYCSVDNREQRDRAGLRVLQLGHPRVRHPQPGAGQGDRLLQPGRHDDA